MYYQFSFNTKDSFSEQLIDKRTSQSSNYSPKSIIHWQPMHPFSVPMNENYNKQVCSMPLASFIYLYLKKKIDHTLCMCKLDYQACKGK